MYKCLECGHIFEEGEAKEWSELIGEYFGAPAYQTFSVCPCCGEDYEETKQCKVCRDHFLQNELHGGVCKSCINGYKSNYKKCYELSFYETEKIKINAFLASIFEPIEIEQILMAHIEKNMKGADCTDFIENDLEWFGEKVAEEVTKNENGKK